MDNQLIFAWLFVLVGIFAGVSGVYDWGKGWIWCHTGECMLVPLADLLLASPLSVWTGPAQTTRAPARCSAGLDNQRLLPLRLSAGGHHGIAAFAERCWTGCLCSAAGSDERRRRLHGDFRLLGEKRPRSRLSNKGVFETIARAGGLRFEGRPASPTPLSKSS